jgi:hypothetical protein
VDEIDVIEIWLGSVGDTLLAWEPMGAYNLLFNGTVGNDTLTVDFSGGNPIPDDGITFNGGLQAGVPGDALIITGNAAPFASQTFDFTGADVDGKHGRVVIDDSRVTRTLFFTGLEPISGGDAIDTVFLLPDVARNPNDDIILRNHVAPGRIEIVDNTGTDFETTDVPNPINSLTVYLGNQGDTITVQDLDEDFAPGAAVDALVIYGGDVADTFNIQSTRQADGGTYSGVTLYGGAGSDVFNISSDAPANSGSLDWILSPLTINGDDHDAGDTTLSVTCNGTTISNTLDSGDVLNVNDADSADDNTYTVTASSVLRTGTATVNYTTIETLNLSAGTGKSQFNVTSTTAGVNTNIVGNVGNDVVAVTTTGAAGNVTIDTGAGADTVTLQSTGTASVTVIHGGGGNDALTLVANGAASGVQLNGQDGTDQINIRSTAAGSVTVASGGANTDTINISSHAIANAGSLDGILGVICVQGDGHDARNTTLSVTCNATTISNTLASGDVLNISDAGDADDNTYTLTATSVSRAGVASIHYATVETLNVTAGKGNDQINVIDTAAGVNTKIQGNAGDDVVDVTITGAASIVIVDAGEGMDTVILQTTGAGSVTSVSGGDGNDTLTQVSNGAASGVGLIFGAYAQDQINIRSTATGSVTVATGGFTSDTINISSDAPANTGSLDGILGTICVAGFVLGSPRTTLDVTCNGKTISNTLPSGNVLNISDAGDGDANTYILNATSVSRTGTARILYRDRIQTLT